jgi:hypothetical protein
MLTYTRNPEPSGSASAPILVHLWCACALPWVIIVISITRSIRPLPREIFALTELGAAQRVSSMALRPGDCDGNGFWVFWAVWAFWDAVCSLRNGEQIDVCCYLLALDLVQSASIRQKRRHGSNFDKFCVPQPFAPAPPPTAPLCRWLAEPQAVVVKKVLGNSLHYSTPQEL